jgi:hypothetical protein
MYIESGGCTDKHRTNRDTNRDGISAPSAHLQKLPVQVEEPPTTRSTSAGSRAPGDLPAQGSRRVH